MPMTPTLPLKTLRRGLLAAVAASALMALAAPDAALAARPATEKSVSHVGNAQTAMEKRDWRTAVIELKNALKADPNNVEARLLLGEAYVKLRNGPAAEKEFRAALDRGAKKRDVMLRLGDALLLQRKFDEALDLVDLRGLSKEQEYEAQLLIGTAHMGLRQIDEARAAYEAAEALNPAHAGAKIGLSRLALMERDIDGSRAHIDEALKLDPKNVEALLIKGELARLSGDFQGAFDEFDAAVALEADSLPAVLGRATALVELNRLDEATRDLDVIFRQVPNHPTAHYLAARVAWQKRDIAKASEHIQATGGALDNFPPAVFLSGLLNFAENNLEQAAYHLSRLVQMAPEHVQARRVLGMVYLRQGNPDQAVRVLEPVVNTAEPDAQLYSLLGYAYMQSGELDRGTEYFDKAVAIDPETSGNWTRLAVSKIVQGDLASAEDDLEKVLEKDPKALQPAIILTMVQLRKGQFAEALAQAERLRKDFPDNPVGSYLAGEVHFRQNKFEEARKAFEEAQALRAENVAPSLKIAQVDIAEGKLDAAERRYRDILQKNGKNVAALAGMADLSLRRNQSEEAVTWLERAVEADPQNVPLHLQLITQYSARNELEKAEAVAAGLTQRFPNEPVSFEALGRVQMTRGKTADALANFERVVALRPDSSKAHHMLAQAEIAADDVEDGRQSLNTALSLAPKPGDFERDRNEVGSAAAILLQLAELEAREKRYDAAIAHAADLGARYPDSRSGEITRANILLQKGDFNDALPIYEKLLADGEGSTVIAINRYRAQMGAGNQKAAFAGLEDWVAKNEGDVVARNVLASAYITAGDYDRAISHYENLRDGSPKDPLILNNIAWLYSQKGDPRAREVAEAAYNLAPQSPEVMDTYAWILVNEGKLDQGLEILKRAALMRPGSPDIRYHFAVALERKGQRDAARRELQDLLALGVAFSEEKEARALLDKLSMR